MAVFGFGRRNAVGRQYNGGNVSVMLPRYTTPPERNTRDWLEMFGRNPRLAVVDRIASDLSTCTGKLYRKDENGEEVEITDHPFLNFMAHPNPLYEMTSGACWRLQQIYLELKGEGYFVYEFDALGRPVELWPLPTHWVQQTPYVGYPYYEIRTTGGLIRQIPVDDIFCMKELNPLDPYKRGLGAAESLADEIETDEYAAKFQKKFFYNDATPTTLVSMPGSSKDQRDRFRSEWNERFRGPFNSHGIATVDGNVTVTKLAENMRDMDMTEGRRFLRDAVLEHFGVPREIMGITESSNRATSEAAQYIYAQNVIMPRLNRREEAINTQILPFYGNDLVWHFDDVVPRSQEFDKAKGIDGWNAGLLTKDEARELLGMEPCKTGGDCFKITISDMFIGSNDDPAEVTTDLMQESTEDAETSVENLGEKVETLEENIGAVEVGAQQMGASAVSACQMGQGAAERFTGAVSDASGGLDDMASSASEAGSAAKKAAGHWNMTAEGLEWVEEAAQAAEAAAESFRDEMDDSGGAAGRFRAQIKKTAESAQDMGTAFKGAMADGLDAGQSIAKSFRTGVTGAMDFTKKRAEIFANNMVRNAKNISKAFQHPIKIIRSGLVSALRRAKKSEDETADGADDAGDHLAEMGAAGEDAGNQIKEAISGTVKAFVGFEAIKRGIELLKQFGAAAVSAFSDAESTSKKFGRSFSEEAAAWADNYADAVHRSTVEVQSFMVSNKAMYSELGITAAAAENLSEMTTSLAYDFGNAFSMDDSEALSLIQSAIGGSTDALNEYGIVLDKTALKNSAAALGLGTNIDALDDAAMAQVRLNAILEQSSDIQKAAVEQTGGLTNSIKSLKGEMADFMADAGEKFSPALEDMVGVFLDEWPELEPTLLEFVGILADGMSAAVPVISNLAQSILPSLISTLGTLFDAAGPVLSVIGDLAQEILPPLAGIISELAANALPPLRDIFDELNYRVVQPLMPVLQELADDLLPVLGMALGSAADMVGPLADAFIPLLTDILPVFGSLVSTLAGSIIPPLTDILQVVIQALQPIIRLGLQIVENILPVATPLIEAAGSVLSGVVVPVLDYISPVLGVIADALGVVVGWVSDLLGFFTSGVSAVVDWFSGLFGGAKDSTDAVQELTGAVSDLDGAAGTETSLAVDTSEYSSSVSQASQQAQEAVSEAATAAREISNENYGQMAEDAETAYASMTLDAENAWDRMEKAASEGAENIIGSIQKILSAADAVSGININLSSSANIPHNADGTDDFEGGWTHINERGGEMAYLPSGTAIIPADKTDEIINNSTSSSSVTYEDHSTFSPTISITLGGETTKADAEEIVRRVKQTMEDFWQEKKEEEYHERTLQGAYAQ